MRKLLLLILLSISIPVNAATYDVNSSGATTVNTTEQTITVQQQTITIPAQQFNIPVNVTGQVTLPDPSLPPPVVVVSGLDVVNVTKYGAIPNDGKDDSASISAALQANPKNATLYFPTGTYDINRMVQLDNSVNLKLLGQPGAVLSKLSTSSGEYLLSFRNAKNVTIEGLTLIGRTTVTDKFVWGEQGVFFGSSDGVTVKNCRFYNFGDAALRITTSSANPGTGVNSFNATVRDNYFENITQVTVTSNDGVGATDGYLFENNVVKNLKGSIKFASRRNGARRLVVRNNRLEGSVVQTNIGLEICSYSDVIIDGNFIEKMSAAAISIYNNPEGQPSWDWGTYKIVNNVLRDNRGFGIRVSPTPAYSIDGVTPKITDIQITGNTVVNQTGTVPAISMSNGEFSMSIVANNVMMNISSKRYVVAPASVLVKDNLSQ